VRAIAYAPPPAASQAICEESEEFVLSCVMRDDPVPRAVPRAIVMLEREVLALDWDTMREKAADWGIFGGWLLRNAECGAGLVGSRGMADCGVPHALQPIPLTLLPLTRQAQARRDAQGGGCRGRR